MSWWSDDVGLVLVTAPSVEPLSLADAKAWLRVQHTAEDDLITDLIVAARQRAELLSERQLITATWRLTLDSFPSGNGGLVIPRPRLISVTSITYVDTAGTTTTMPAADYIADTDSEPGWIVPAYGDIWPTPRVQANAVKVTYTAGYGAAATNVPKELILGIKGHVAVHYQKRMDPGEMDRIDQVFRNYWHGNCHLSLQ